MSANPTPATSIAPPAGNSAPDIVRIVLAAVCVADIILGLIIVSAPQFLFHLFDVPLPDDLLWFQLIGLMLIPLAVDGLVGFRMSARYRSNVVVSCAARFGTAVFLLIVASIRNVPWVLIAMALGEGLVGFVTVYYLRQGARTRSTAEASKSPGGVR
jgi:hypothetical protein